jgi:RNA polymerase sigma-70 factor (ECF subfamily)
MNADAVAQLFERFRKPVRHYLSRVSNVPSGDIDDLAQEVFIRLLRYESKRLVTNPAGYLFTVAAHVASEWRQLARIRNPHDDSWLEELVLEKAEQPEEILESEDRDRYVQSKLDELPPRQRAVLLMHVRGGLTYKRIAEELGLTYRIVLRDLTRAYSAMRRAGVAYQGDEKLNGDDE